MIPIVLTASRCIWLLLPAGAANAVPPIATRILGPGRPISMRLFGAHKTWQGLISGGLAGAATFLLQRWIDHENLPFVAAIAMSAGALGGDLVKSFAKRRAGIAPGKAWIPFDQLDYVIGALILTFPFVHFGAVEGLITIGAFVLLHLLFSVAGYFLGVKEQPI